MPRGDRTGPLGQGSMTGRGLGICNPNMTSNTRRNLGYGAGIGAGIGLGLGLGRGLGRRMGAGRSANNFVDVNNEQISEEDRKAALENQKQMIQNELDAMN